MARPDAPTPHSSKRLRVIGEREDVPVGVSNWISFTVQKREEVIESDPVTERKVFEESNAVLLHTNLRQSLTEISLDDLQALKREVEVAIEALKKKRKFELVKTYIDKL
jgi:hypothetical protein